jgi:RNA polymerase sigma factor (sigma-70 family)
MFELVRGAAEGDAECWNALVKRFSRLVWSVARSFGLSPADAAEISQTTWLLLAEHLDRIKRPERLGAWLVTTTRRECNRHLRVRGQQVFSEPSLLDEHLAGSPSADLGVLIAERDAALWYAFVQLPERSRTLLVMLLHDPPISYGEISKALDMPIGSIGPKRARALAALRRLVEDGGVFASE